nr:hypothetical protein [Elizabethkingia bruuniana]
MKSDKLDNYIKNQLEEREITPSRNLWADIRLDLEETPQKRKNYTVIWLAAASVILLCSLAGIFIFKNDKQNNNPVIAKQTQPVNSSEPKEISTVETNIKTDSVLRKESLSKIWLSSNYLRQRLRKHQNRKFCLKLLLHLLKKLMQLFLHLKISL